MNQETGVGPTVGMEAGLGPSNVVYVPTDRKRFVIALLEDGNDVNQIALMLGCSPVACACIIRRYFKFCRAGLRPW